MRNKQKYIQMMNEIHVSGDVLRKVKDMGMEKKGLKKKQVLKYVGQTAAALAFCLVASNGICYAATGSTWVTKAIVYINGQAVEQDVVWTQDGDDRVASIEVPDDGDGVIITSYMADDDGNTVPVDVNMDEAMLNEELMEPEVAEKDGRIYLNCAGQEVDLTDDLADGEAEGDITLEEKEYHYIVIATEDGYEVSVSYDGGK